jgi:hypothetical protein
MHMKGRKFFNLLIFLFGWGEGEGERVEAGEKD